MEEGYMEETLRMYIAPPLGAMQFELTPTIKMAPVVHQVEKPEWVWVGQPIPNRRGCDCKLAYPLLLEYLPDGFRQTATEATQRMQVIPVTCACQGRIIE